METRSMRTITSFTNVHVYHAHTEDLLVQNALRVLRQLNFPKSSFTVIQR